MTQDLFNVQVWEQAWKADPKAMGNKMKRMGIDFAHSFDHKAKAFNEEVFSEAGRRRAERIVGWNEGQGVDFGGLSVLDIGAASGGFSVPFAERGASVTAVEPCIPLVELLEANTAELNRDRVRVSIVPEAFEDIDLADRGWEQAFDLVFVSMCPTIVDWDSVERVLSCARQFCYISLPAGGSQHSLMNEVLPLLPVRKSGAEASDMAYLLHLLYLKGYSYESIVTREMKTTELSPEAAIEEVMAVLQNHHAVPNEASRKIVTDYVRRTYGDGPVTISQGGRFGKVLIRLKEQNMYSWVKV
ncbi:class I SAM-dependent methyltransferase [Paenibacillus wynnii]|uniref:SAM-dependent methyltransferase n=1 Tax=Paenibacillus wynnii TaxID=268407 RepID=A0A098MBF2_9BACL|nr:class I SAM-dependent methyltransferase [Paenibacillus wynnii]KGE18882.1 SAM-dependent methyltransferase [Paenibacillus wynnii]